MNEKLLNGKELAEALERHSCFVTAMKHAGYTFQYPALKKTTLPHALAALARVEHFNAEAYRAKGWERRPKCLAAPASHPA